MRQTADTGRDQQGADAATIAELQSRCALLETLIDELPVTVWVKDVAGRYLIANKFHCRIVNRPSKDFIGHTSFDLFPFADATRFAERDRRMLESGVGDLTEDEHPSIVDGREYWLASRKTPLTLPNGERIIMNVGREITDRHHAEVRQRELFEQLEHAHAIINEELSIARAMQLAILPSSFPPMLHCNAAARMLPATTMGGDFYDFIPLPEGKVGLVIADVAGKGVPAAFFMAITRTHLRNVAASASGPAQCLQITNDMLCTQNPMELFVTVFYAVFCPATGQLSYANGGHNPPYVRSADGRVRRLDTVSDMVLGMAPDTYQQHTESLQPGDVLIMYSDGVTESFDVDANQYGEDRLLDLVAAGGASSPQRIVDDIFSSVQAFAGQAPQADDITVAVMAWQPQVSARG